MTPYYESENAALYCGDARHILPRLELEPDAMITDPVWPNASVDLGCTDPYKLLTEVLEQLSCRMAIHLGCDSDPRILTAVPVSIPFFRQCNLELARPHYKGRLLYGNDVAYLFGEPPPSRPGAHCIPGKCWSVSNKGKEADHPCPRKLEHVLWLVGFWGGDVTLDPFMGSGTTGVAALMQGKRFVGIDINEDYCREAKRRIVNAEAQLCLM